MTTYTPQPPPTPSPRTARRTSPRAAGLVAGLVAASLGLSACSLVGSDGESVSDAARTVVLVTHDSFAVSESVQAAFTAETGYDMEIRALGDAGSMVSQLVLSKDAPLGDAVFGVDTTFASRAIDEGIIAPYVSSAAGEELIDVAVDPDSGLTPISYSDVCVNVDHEWFTQAGLAEPATLDDLLKPEYRDLLVVEDPASSSPGLAFLLATVDAYGDDGWEAYWAALRDNGVKVAGGWSDAYYVDFSGPSSEGTRPLVVSYASSPPYEVPQGSAVAPTGALLDTCFRQVEYAGVLEGAANPEGARALIDFLLSDTFQNDIPGQMYVYPVSASATLPAEWLAFAPLAESPFAVAPEDIAANREAWVSRWTDIVVG